jgi:hypothetical protein
MRQLKIREPQKTTRLKETEFEAEKLRGNETRLQRAIEAEVECRTRTSYSNPVLMARLKGRTHTLH